MESTATGQTAQRVPYTKRGFWALFITQFQGAFNDNIYQFLILFATAAALQPSYDATGGFTLLGRTFTMTPTEFATSVSNILFAIPFIIFAGFFGTLADKYPKQRIAMAVKLWEAAMMLLGALAFYMGNPIFAWCLLFGMGIHSTMFAPVKYGILPEMLPEHKLSWANGIFQMGTLVAIIAGVLVAGKLYNAFEHALWIPGLILFGLSMIGFTASLFMAKPTPANPSLRLPMNPLSLTAEMRASFRFMWNDSVMLYIVVGYVYFWFAGALARANIIVFFRDTLNFPESDATIYIGLVTLGIGLGALYAGFISRGKIELGLTPIGAAGMTFFSLLLAMPAGVYDALLLDPLGLSRTIYYVLLGVFIFGLGFFAGMFDVPLISSILQRAPISMKGSVVAATNMLTWFGIFSASWIFGGFTAVGLSSYQIYFLSGMMTLAIGLFICFRLPILLLRAYLWLLSNTRYRVRTLGRLNIPEQGGVLLVSNIASMCDALAVQASTDRAVRFVVGKEALDTPWMRWVLKVTQSIVYDPDAADDAAVVAEIQQALREGWAVCVTTEAPFSKDGQRPPFTRDYARLLEGTGACLTPVHCDRLWGRLYRFDNKKLVRLKPPHRGYVIQVNYGERMPAASTLDDLRRVHQALGTEAYMQRPLGCENLHRGFVRSARRHMRKLALADAVSGELSYFKTLVGSIVFGRKLNQILDKHEMVGVLLPPSIGGVLTNIALGMMGRVSVNLNYTASNEAIASCARQCGITHVITSKKFLERLPLEVPGKTILLEDVRESVKGKDRIIALLFALFAPVWLIEKLVGCKRKRSSDDVATIIFSSGSEGDPKGIVLTQRNVIANVEAVLEVFPHYEDTCIIGYLPLFHSFGYTVTIWMGLLQGIRLMYHPNPLEPKIIGDLIKKYRGTIMIGTSTLLQGFIRRCTADQFASLDFVVTGAEKLQPRVRTAFKDKFGVEPLEGYGTTECAPAVSVNIPDCISPGFHYVGTRHGTIGRPFPGQSVRTVDTETGRELGAGEAGMLYVKGVNIMRGYLNQPEKTAKVLKDGWYETGDIAAISEDGFITITDRLARFSKIAGEMVPHTKIEETLHNLLDLAEQMLAVTSVADEKKGERLVVLHTLDETQLQELLGRLDQSGLPNLWIPRPSSFYRIEAIPVLGTGKMDLKGVKKMAQEMAQSEEA